jgi:argininosuccinate lyase
LFQFTQGIDLDSRLFAHEIRVQIAWAGALWQAEIFTAREHEQIVQVLQQIRELMEQGQFEWREEDEDIHMNIERHLSATLPEVGPKIHLGRSRNDLIATSLRLYVAQCLSESAHLTEQLARACVAAADRWIDIIVPGTTHLQHGQPLRLSHIFAGHTLALVRNINKIKLAEQGAMAYLPLGSAALAGTTVAVDLSALAETLGFAAVSVNSYDAVGDRDFILDALDIWATLAVHLSRLSEDIIYWTSTPVGLLRLPPEWSTGSSIMPNKRNPDVAELTRAKSAQIIAQANSAKILMKGLPSSYSSDLHELKRIFITSLDQLSPTLSVFSEFVAGLTVSADRAHELLARGHILATEVTNYLADSGLSFREAYSRVAEWVTLADQKQISLEEAAKLSGVEIPNLSFENAVEARDQVGGTAKAQVQATLAYLRKCLKK